MYATAIVLLTACTANTQTQEASQYSEAVRNLAREQSLAESYAGILKEFGRQDIQKYARGIELYATAKADYDGLIEQMRTHLIKGQRLDQSEQYQLIMKSAADKRIAFTNFVSEEVIGKEPGKRFPAAVFTAATELIPVLTDAGKAIWEQYRKAKDQEKQKILAQLSGLKWKSFDKIGN
ncbi:MAG TPA: hypothetical protein VMU60_09490 [Syntrophobacteria bacterium]|jgi:hypothetical protein|nr:hypothetical protein [Syntrophobacteria bacterium]